MKVLNLTRNASNSLAVGLRPYILSCYRGKCTAATFNVPPEARGVLIAEKAREHVDG
jgi:hypothetical protein